MASSQPTTTTTSSSHDSPRRAHTHRQPLLDSEPVQVAPYLTHVVAHHGQLTLIPPQNAGRIRKSKSSKKKRIPAPRDEEPRFTTAVPPSSSRKLHPTSAQIRTRKHAISAPSPTTPTTPTARRFDPIPDDQSIPDYPPPSFEDAIASPHIPPHLVSIPSVQPPVQHSASINNLGQHPYTSDVASQSSATILSSAALSTSSPAMSMTSLDRPSAQNYPSHEPQRLDAALYSQQHPYTSPAASQSSATAFSASSLSNVSPAVSQASLSRPTEHIPSMSTTTLLSPAVTESTALSDMSLLRPPRTRNMQPSPLAQSNSRHVPASPVRLTSPSTTTLLTPTTAMRDSPGHSQVTISRPQPSLRGPSPDLDEGDMDEPESPLVEPLTPLSPPASPSPSRHVHYRSSVSTVSDLVEELSLEPYQRWSADRRLGLTLEERVQREFERRNTTEAREAFGIVSRSPLMQAESSSSMPSTPPSSPGPTAQARRCSHCGSVRPLECGDSQTINDHSSDDERDLDDNRDEDEDDFSAARRSSPLPFARGGGAGRSPYLHPAPKMHARGRFHSHSPEPGSPASPLSPSVSFFKMPSAWASTVTLSLANALGPHKGSLGSSSASSSGQASTSASGVSASGSSGSGLKRKESFGVKKLFGSLKGKERERESKQREREYAALPPPSASVSSSDSSTESVDGWEVVSGGDSPGGHSSSSTSTTPSSPSTYPSPSRSMHEASPSSPTTESARAAAFLNRPVRHRPSPLPLDSPASTPSSPHPLSSPASPPLTHAASPSSVSAAARPYLPEKSPLRLIASANHLRQAHAQALGSPVSPLMAGSPKTLRGSPSVVWKPAPAGAATQASPVQRSPLWQGMYQQPVGQQSQVRIQNAAAQAQVPVAVQTRAPPPPHLQSQSQPLSQPPPSPVGPRGPPAGPRSSSPAPAAAALSITANAPPQTPSQPMAHLRRRREVTPPPSSHRRVMLACDTAALSASDPRPGMSDEAVGTGVGPVGEPGSVSESLSIEQLMARSAGQGQTPAPTPTTPSRAGIATGGTATPATAGSTPTTPTSNTAFSPGQNQNVSQHYRGRPLPQLPPDAAAAETTSMKRVPDVGPVNRVPESSGGDDLPPPASPVLSAIQPPEPPTASASVIPPPMQMERSDSGDSVVEDARAAGEGARPEFLPITDLDVLASRLVDAPQDGRNYEDLLRISEIMGPAASATSTPVPNTPAASEKATVPYIGSVEVERRRVLKDGRVKLKLSLLGVAVDRCGVCLSQFRREEHGAMTPVCRHAFHEACLRRWLRTAGVCPICRMPLTMDD